MDGSNLSIKYSQLIDEATNAEVIDDSTFAISMKNFIIITKLITDSSNLSLRGHTGMIFSLIDLQNEFLLSGSDDKTIKIWNKTDWSLIETLKGHSKAIRCLVKLSKSLVASGSDDKTIKIWDLNKIHNKKVPIKEIKTLKGHLKPIKSLVYMKSNNFLVGSQCDLYIYIWNLNDFSLKTKLKGLNSVLSLTPLSNDFLISGTSNGYIQIWNVTSSTLIKSYFRDSAAILSFGLLSERSILIGYANGKIEAIKFIY